MGLCTQKDILYEEMTVYEHLDYIAQIKGMSGELKEREIKFIIQK